MYREETSVRRAHVYSTDAYNINANSIYFKLWGTLPFLDLPSTNYFIPLFRSLLFAPMPFVTFVALKNISLPEFTTLNMSAPLFGSIYGIFLLKERINSST